jgi:hypothetical protein
VAPLRGRGAVAAHCEMTMPSGSAPDHWTAASPSEEFGR